MLYSILFHVKEVVNGSSFLKPPKKRRSFNFFHKKRRFGEMVAESHKKEYTASLVSDLTDGTAINKVSISSFLLHLLFLS